MIYILIAAAVFALDFFVKRRIDRERKPGEESLILKDRIIIRKYYNRGAMLEFLAKWPRLVQVFSGVALTVICIMFLLLLREKGFRGLKLGLAMILGGGAGNLCDRLTKGHVVDYFSFKSRFPRLQRVIFNLSDMFVFLGTLLVIIHCFHNSSARPIHKGITGAFTR